MGETQKPDVPNIIHGSEWIKNQWIWEGTQAEYNALTREQQDNKAVLFLIDNKVV